MVDVTVQFEVDDRPVDPAELEDEYLVDMLEHTRQQIEQDVRRKLADVRCPEHGTLPHVIVTGMYSSDAEQMELSYHVDSCCQLLLLRAVQALNH